MNYLSYLQYFESVLTAAAPQSPYDNPVYLHYAKLSQTRMARWWKTLEISRELAVLVKNISAPQQWIVITEPWCGDAAPAVPLIVKLAELNPLLKYDLQLRDSEPFLINDYLTNGGKSIPKLIVRDADGKDLFTWGPRPAGAQQLADSLRASGTPYDVVATELQNWYNRDKGISFQQELCRLMS